jgi:hypothetical protein
MDDSPFPVKYKRFFILEKKNIGARLSSRLGRALIQGGYVRRKVTLFGLAGIAWTKRGE